MTTDEQEEKFLFDTAIEQRTELGLKGTLDSFMAGAQWQARRSYSEEEVKALIIRAVDEFSAFHSNTLKMQCAEEFFDKNKK